MFLAEKKVVVEPEERRLAEDEFRRGEARFSVLEGERVREGLAFRFYPIRRLGNICCCFSRDTVRMTRRKMCVKPMEENDEDKVVSMIINYFTARVNMRSKETEWRW